MATGGEEDREFTVDGVSYRSLDEVPEPHRSQFAEMLRRTDWNVVPESSTMSVTSQRFTVNGVTYDSIDDMPPELRAQLTGILADHDADGVPDIMDAAFRATGATRGDDAATRLARPTGRPPASRPAARATPIAPIVQRAGMSGKAKLLTTMVVADLIIAGVVLWFVIR